jgi:hypothetical protein
MTNSAFKYEVGRINDNPYIAITDLNIGSMSVIRDIKNIIQEIISAIQVKYHDLANYLILCRDEDLVWDGYDPISDKFVELSKLDLRGAFEKYYELRWYEVVKMLRNCNNAKFL